MRILRTRLVGVCQHADLSCDWHPGLNGIIGPNGSGKSNLLRMIELAITGQSPNFGKQAENICQYISDGDPSYILLEGEHRGARFSITRFLRGGQTKLHLPGREVLGANAATDALLEFLGITRQMLSQFVFVRQGAISEFITITPAARKEALQKLFGLHRFQQVWSALGHVRSVDLSGLKSELIEMAQRLEEEISTLDEYRRENQRISNELFTDQEIDRLKKFLAETARAKEIKAQLSQLTESLAQLDEQASDAHEAYTSAHRHHQRLVAECEARLSEDERCCKLLESLPVLAERGQAADDLDRALSNTRRIEEERKTIPEDLDGSIKQLNEFLAEVTRQRREAKDAWNAIVRGKLPSCPVCGTPTETIHDAILERRRASVAKRYDAQEARGKLRALIRLRKRREELARKKYALEELIVQLTERLEHFPDIEEPSDEEIAQARKHLQETERRVKELQKAQAAADDLLRRSEKISMKRNSLQERIHELEEELTRYSCLRPEEEASIEQSLQEQQQFRTQLEVGKARCEEQSRVLELLIQRIMDKSDMLDQLEAENRWCAHAEGIRSIVHKNAAPADLAAEYMRLAADKTNEMLDKLGANFRVTLDVDDFSFWAHFSDGRKQRDGRLSGGQQVLLSIAFRVAVNLTFTDSLGLLCLDEPTTFLDDEHRERLNEALTRLRRLSHSHALQCLVVTHDRQLVPVFDNVVALSATEDLEHRNGEQDPTAGEKLGQSAVSAS